MFESIAIPGSHHSFCDDQKGTYKNNVEERKLMCQGICKRIQCQQIHILNPFRSSVSFTFESIPIFDIPTFNIPES